MKVRLCQLIQDAGCLYRAVLRLHVGAGCGEFRPSSSGSLTRRPRASGEVVVRPVVAWQLEAVTGFLDPRRVVVTVPDVGHDDRRLAEIEALGERVVAAVMDDGVDLGDDGRLREPAIDDEFSGTSSYCSL